MIAILIIAAAEMIVILIAETGIDEMIAISTATDEMIGTLIATEEMIVEDLAHGTDQRPMAQLKLTTDQPPTDQQEPGMDQQLMAQLVTMDHIQLNLPADHMIEIIVTNYSKRTNY
mmetsp:Transcript_71209/g.82831  ORF Transcript_71209/g.82831 Transcript_71209/m.82831 type:complete len:116 (-) Transcript_71209:117-464(-)